MIGVGSDSQDHHRQAIDGYPQRLCRNRLDRAWCWRSRDMQVLRKRGVKRDLAPPDHLAEQSLRTES